MARSHRVTLCVVLAFAACNGSESAAPDETGDAGDGALSPPGSCYPVPGSVGNSIHVGAYCRPGLADCAQYSGEADVCAIDVDPKGGQFCIKIGCATHEDCGEHACCTGKPSSPIHACVPAMCVDYPQDSGICQPVPGTDSGASDAASD